MEDLLNMTVGRFANFVFGSIDDLATPYEKGMRSRVLNFFFDKGFDVIPVHDFLMRGTGGLKVKEGRRSRKLKFGPVAWDFFREKCKAVGIDLPEW